MKSTLLLLFTLPLALLGQTLYPTSNGELVLHENYMLSYLEEHEQAEWVYYLLTKEMVYGGYSRTDDFRPDKFVETNSAQLTDYKGSGYDRGHLAPAADMKHTIRAMSESFLLSNMSPQVPGFNRGKWKTLEELFRCWTKEKDSLYIATGGILTDDLYSIGPNNVSVPKYFYKIAYSVTDNTTIAFLMPNQKLQKTLKYYVVTIDEVEELTNINFYRGIDESLEESIDLSAWNFTCKSTYVPTTKIKTTTKSSGNSSGRCQAKTQAGTQCKRNAKENENKCWQHLK